MASKPVQCANIGGTLVAVLAFIAFINGVLVWCGSLVGVENLTFEYVLGLLFIPAAWLMGVETAVSKRRSYSCNLLLLLVRPTQ